MQSTSSSFEDQLRDVLNFLNVEGLYTAEEALLQELAHRIPPTEHSGGTHGGTSRSSSPLSAPHHDVDQCVAAAKQDGEPHHPAPPSDSATTSSVGGAHHSRQHSTDSGLDGAIRLATPVSSTHFLHRTHSSTSRQHSDDIDEYTDEHDVGYIRQPIRDQEMFLATEVLYPDDTRPGSSWRYATTTAGYSSHSSPLSNASPHTAGSSRPTSVPSTKGVGAGRMVAPPVTKHPYAMGSGGGDGGVGGGGGVQDEQQQHQQHHHYEKHQYDKRAHGYPSLSEPSPLMLALHKEQQHTQHAQHMHHPATHDVHDEATTADAAVPAGHHAVHAVQSIHHTHTHGDQHNTIEGRAGHGSRTSSEMSVCEEDMGGGDGPPHLASLASLGGGAVGDGGAVGGAVGGADDAYKEGEQEEYEEVATARGGIAAAITSTTTTTSTPTPTTTIDVGGLSPVQHALNQAAASQAAAAAGGGGGGTTSTTDNHLFVQYQFHSSIHATHGSIGSHAHQQHDDDDEGFPSPTAPPQQQSTALPQQRTTAPLNLFRPLTMFGKLFGASSSPPSSTPLEDNPPHTSRHDAQQRRAARHTRRSTSHTADTMLTNPLLGHEGPPGGPGTTNTTANTTTNTNANTTTNTNTTSGSKRMLSGKPGTTEASFSFPLTPGTKAEPPEPVFPSWPSFKSYDMEHDGHGHQGGLCGSMGTSPAASQSSYGALSTSRGGSYPGSPGYTQSPTGGGGTPPDWGSRPHGQQHGQQHESVKKWQTYSSRSHASSPTPDAPEYDEDTVTQQFDILQLNVYHKRGATGFEESKELSLPVGSLVAGRYQVLDYLGSAAFSNAVQAADLKEGGLVCLKIVKNNKDYFDQSLDEVKLLRYVNTMDPDDRHGILRLYDFFYYKEHLFLVTELLRANLYEFQKYNHKQGGAPYFTLPRMQKIATQVLKSLAFLHSLNLIHSDLKPENILIKSYSRCEVKVIDLGSSCFVTDRLSGYVQSRSYRAPEVVLGLPYGTTIDIWSLGCIMAELASGHVLFQNDSLASMFARLEGILGPIPDWMLAQGRYAHRIYTRHGLIYQRDPKSDQVEVLRPKKTTLAARVPAADAGMLSFLMELLQVDPHKRPTAEEALQHPWLSHVYEEEEEGG